MWKEKQTLQENGPEYLSCNNDFFGLKIRILHIAGLTGLSDLNIKTKNKTKVAAFKRRGKRGHFCNFFVKYF